jgi:uncharacterized protein
MSLAILFGLGICTGLLAGLFGLGGGILIVPVLNLWGFPVVTAAATSLIGVFLTALSGTIRYSWTNQLNWQNAWQIALFGVSTVQIGAWLARHLPDSWLAISFSLLLLGAIYLMGLRKTLIDTESFASLLDSDSPGILGKNQTRSRWEFAKIGGLGGAIAGLFGIGGGIVMVPLQVLLLGESIPHHPRRRHSDRRFRFSPICLEWQCLVDSRFMYRLRWHPGGTTGNPPPPSPQRLFN